MSHENVSCIMWFPRFLIALVWLIVYSNRTPNLAPVHYDVYRHVLSHSCPHIYPRFPMHVFMYNHRVLYRMIVSLSQLGGILYSGDMSVNPGPLRLGFTNCYSIRNKGSLQRKSKMVAKMYLARLRPKSKGMTLKFSFKADP